MDCRLPKGHRIGQRLIVISLFLLFPWACSKDDGEEPLPQPTQRTILYYLAADNNLYGEADDKIAALQMGFPGGNNRLLVYQDRKDEPPQLLEIYPDESGENQIRTVRTYPEQNSATGETLQLLLEEVEQLFPADSYGLILFSHATGWLPKGRLSRPLASMLSGQAQLIKTYTVAMDGADELDLAEFAAAIPDGFFDFMVFEACFMAGIEVLYELKDKTEYILSSSAEMISPGFTPIYPESLSLLFEPKADLVTFARDYFNFWNSQSGDYRSATISVINTVALTPLADWVQQHATGEIPAEQVKEVQHFDRYASHRLFFDFEDYYQRIAAQDAAHQLATLLTNAVTYQAATPSFIPGQRGFDIQAHSGITIYIPQEQFAELNQVYQTLSWYRDSQ